MRNEANQNHEIRSFVLDKVRFEGVGRSGLRDHIESSFITEVVIQLNKYVLPRTKL